MDVRAGRGTTSGGDAALDTVEQLTHDAAETAERVEKERRHVVASMWAAAHEDGELGRAERKWLRARANAIRHCGQHRFVRTLDGRPHGTAMLRCRSRACPRCWHSSASQREKLASDLVEECRQAGAEVAFVTLTTATQAGEAPRDAMRAVQRVWRTMRKRQRRDKRILGGIVRRELTLRHPTTGERRAHAHMHVVAVVEGDAEAVGLAITRDWMRAARDAGRRAVDAAQDVQRVDHGDSAASYVLKYLTKPQDDEVWRIALAIRGLRCTQWWGCWHGAARGPWAELAAAVKARHQAESERWGMLSWGDLGIREAQIPEEATAAASALVATGQGMRWHQARAEGDDVWMVDRLRRWAELPVDVASLRMLAKGAGDYAPGWQTAIDAARELDAALAAAAAGPGQAKGKHGQDQGQDQGQASAPVASPGASARRRVHGSGGDGAQADGGQEAVGDRTDGGTGPPNER